MNPTLGRLTRLASSTSRESDGSLLAAFLTGNQNAFRELVERHSSLVFGVCNRILRHQQDAEDAFQAVFIVLARRAADVWPRDAIGSWLYGVASRVALKARILRDRRLQHEGLLVSEDRELIIRHEVLPVDFETVETIDRAVRKLPEVYRAAVVACDLQGLSRKDAAGRLGWTEGTLSGRLARARKLLADRLRKSRITFSVAGLAVLSGTESSVRAGLIEAVMKVADSRVGVSAPVAALTQGVVQTMSALKLKSAAAAVLVACTIGFGAWSAGAGDDPGKKESPGKTLAVQPPVKAQGPDLAKLRLELKAIEQELIELQIESKVAGENPTENVKKRLRLVEDKLAELKRLAAEGRAYKVSELVLAPDKLDPALKELEGKWRIENIRDGKNVQQIDPKLDFVIEVVGNSLFMPYRESDGTVKRKEYKIAIDASKNPKTIDLIQPEKPVGSGIYEFTAAGTTCAVCHASPFGLKQPIIDLVAVCKPALKYSTGMRLAVASNGPRPTKFGGTETVLEFQLTRTGGVYSRDLLQFGHASDKLKGSYLLSAEMLHLRDALTEEEQARARLAMAKADLEQAKAQVEVAAKTVETLRARIANLEKLVTLEKPSPPLPVKDEATFSVHIRTQFAPEKVIRVKTTGSQTVLEGLAYAAEDMAIKPEGISVWVIREKALLPVDLSAILQKADAKTNYQLKAGDQLFVQSKVGK